MSDEEKISSEEAKRIVDTLFNTLKGMGIDTRDRDFLIFVCGGAATGSATGGLLAGGAALSSSTIAGIFVDIVVSGGVVGLVAGLTAYCVKKSKYDDPELARSIFERHEIVLDQIKLIQNINPNLHHELTEKIQRYSSMFSNGLVTERELIFVLQEVNQKLDQELEKSR